MLARRLALWLLALPVLQLSVSAGSSISADIDSMPCKPDQGLRAASFGILAGQGSPLAMQPLDLLGVEAPGALPLANPVLTVQHLPGAAAIAQPALAMHPDAPHEAFLFFAARACDAGGGGWGIAAASSVDGGWQWGPAGWVLREEGSDVVGAAVVHHDGEWYLLPEVTGSTEVMLYRATRFPSKWVLDRVLLALERPLRGASLAQHGGHWWLVGSHPGPGLDGEDNVLAVFRAPALQGPWAPHLNGSFAAAAATAAGALFEWDGQVHRVGRSCRRGACGPAQLLRMSLSEGGFGEQQVQAELAGQLLWRQRSRWDSAGWGHLSVAQRADGTFLAAVEGQRLPHVPHSLPRQLAAAVHALRALALLYISALLVSAAARLPTLRAALLRQRWGRAVLAAAAAGAKQRSSEGGSALPGKRWAEQEYPCIKGPHSVVSNEAVQLDIERCQGFAGGWEGSCSVGTHSSLLPRSRCGSANATHRRADGSGCDGGFGRGAARIGAVAGPSSAGWRARVLCLRLRPLPWWLLLALAALTLGALWAAQAAARVAAPFAEPAVAVAVQGRYSRFTLMVMSYDRRLEELRWYVSHYSQCPSVGEILVVWNRGDPPDSAGLGSAVPVRVRVEKLNSMNNRFRPDPDIKFRAVLSLDDDIMMPCTTVEAAFAAWRAAPDGLLGFYPRLVVPDRPGGPPVYRFEEFVFQQGAYNAILAGAAFMDAATLFPLYFSDAVAPARALVDEVFNCDDLLLNFVAANRTASGGAGQPAPAQLMRPRRRLDLSRLSGVGISHDLARFKAAADRCLADFSALFGGCPLVMQAVPEGYGSPPNCHVGLGLDCMYLRDP